MHAGHVRVLYRIAHFPTAESLLRYWDAPWSPAALRYANHRVCLAANHRLDVLGCGLPVEAPRTVYTLTAAIERAWVGGGGSDAYRAAQTAVAETPLADDTLVL